MQFVQDYIKKKLEDSTFDALANELGISAPMINNYNKGEYNPSLNTAKKIYTHDGTVLHPFSEDSLIFEIEKDLK